MDSRTVPSRVRWWRNPPHRLSPHRDWHTAYAGASWTGGSDLPPAAPL